MKTLKTEKVLEESCPRRIMVSKRQQSNSLPDTIPLPVCAFKFCYSKVDENYAEKLVEEIKNGGK